MSQWTHINGTIRIDHFRDLEPELDFNKVIGRTCAFADPEKIWNACTVPCGSEGSLQYIAWVNPEKNSMAAYTVTIFGDLRDYDNVPEIVAWFDKITTGKDLMIRSAILEISVEGKGGVLLAHRDNELITLKGLEW
jgi:hypothetical protein